MSHIETADDHERPATACCVHNSTCLLHSSSPKPPSTLQLSCNDDNTAFRRRPHPLAPVSNHELTLMQELLGLEPHILVATIALVEPTSSSWLEQQTKRQTNPQVIHESYHDRRVSTVAWDPQKRLTLDIIVNLTQRHVERQRELVGVVPTYVIDPQIAAGDKEFMADERVRAALEARGVTDLSTVVFSVYCAGYTSEEDNAIHGLRIVRSLVLLSPDTNCKNFYGHPVENLVITSELDGPRILEVQDYGAEVPIPKCTANYDLDGIQLETNIPYFPSGVRNDLKPLYIEQNQGPSFRIIDNHQVKWHKWSFRVSFNVREALVLHLIEYDERSLIYRASLAECYVPYGDASPTHRFKDIFDGGECGLGTYTNSLVNGCDCLGEIYYFDAVVHDQRGAPVSLPRAVCLHEEDLGILCRHTKDGSYRLRRLVLQTITTLGNYDYAMHWYFYEDGSFEYEIKLTGIISSGAVLPGSQPVSGSLVAPGVYGPHHQHYFCLRIQWMLDGPRNALIECNYDPSSNCFQETQLETACNARCTQKPSTGRHWKVINPDHLNRFHRPVAYRILPGHHTYPFTLPSSIQYHRAGFTRSHLWATPYADDEYFAAGRFPYQSDCRNDGLPAYSERWRDQSLVDSAQLVTWHVLGCTHIVRPEDWPVMPVECLKIRMEPDGFFNANPLIQMCETNIGKSTATVINPANNHSPLSAVENLDSTPTTGIEFKSSIHHPLDPLTAGELTLNHIGFIFSYCSSKIFAVQPSVICIFNLAHILVGQAYDMIIGIFHAAGGNVFHIYSAALHRRSFFFGSSSRDESESVSRKVHPK